MITLKELPIGKTATVERVGGDGALRQHFLDMGLIPQADVTMVKHAPMGDPVEVRVHGYELTLRLDDAARIEVSDVRDAGEERKARRAPAPLSHPGLGEGGARFHDKATETPLPDGTTITFALAGNQNCGKTTLFNQLTGSNQHVGNFPGVTVDRKDGAIRGHSDTLVTDLPGIYSLSPYTSEELVTRAFLLDEHPDGIINIVDATNIERNLYLTMQLMELGIPMVLALNMMDEVTGNGGSIRVNEMEELLGIPVVPMSAAKNEGIAELVDHAVHVARFQESPVRAGLLRSGRPRRRGAPLPARHHAPHRGPCRARGHPAALRREQAGRGRPAGARCARPRPERARDARAHRQPDGGRARARTARPRIADMRFSFIERVCAHTVVKPHESREHERSQTIDRVLTGRFTAIPAFVAIMALVFWLTFNVIGAWLSGAAGRGYRRGSPTWRRMPWRRPRSTRCCSRS